MSVKKVDLFEKVRQSRNICGTNVGYISRLRYSKISKKKLM